MGEIIPVGHNLERVPSTAERRYVTEGEECSGCRLVAKMGRYLSRERLKYKGLGMVREERHIVVAVRLTVLP